MQECLVVFIHRIEVLDQPKEASAVEGLECRLDGLPAWQRAFLLGHAPQIPSTMVWCISLPNPTWLGSGHHMLSVDVRLAPKATDCCAHAKRREGPCVDGSGLASRIFTLRRWSERPCVRPGDAVHMTAGHNALRGSGPDQKHAFEDAMAHVGCPDRRIDRRCIKCCSPSQPLRHTGCPV